MTLSSARSTTDNTRGQHRLVPVVGPGRGIDTLVADGGEAYHSGLFNDRLLRGMKGIVSEAELQ
jgi:hypothetical protein